MDLDTQFRSDRTEWPRTHPVAFAQRGKASTGSSAESATAMADATVVDIAPGPGTTTTFGAAIPAVLEGHVEEHDFESSPD